MICKEKLHVWEFWGNKNRNYKHFSDFVTINYMFLVQLSSILLVIFVTFSLKIASLLKWFWSFLLLGKICIHAPLPIVHKYHVLVSSIILYLSIKWTPLYFDRKTRLKWMAFLTVDNLSKLEVLFSIILKRLQQAK